jgi:hypothetical protein
LIIPDGRAVALTYDRRAFEEDCRRTAIVISRLRALPWVSLVARGLGV